MIRKLDVGFKSGLTLRGCTFSFLLIVFFLSSTKTESIKQNNCMTMILNKQQAVCSGLVMFFRGWIALSGSVMCMSN